MPKRARKVEEAQEELPEKKKEKKAAPSLLKQWSAAIAKMEPNFTVIVYRHNAIARMVFVEPGAAHLSADKHQLPGPWMLNRENSATAKFTGVKMLDFVHFLQKNMHEKGMESRCMYGTISMWAEDTAWWIYPDVLVQAFYFGTQEFVDKAMKDVYPTTFDANFQLVFGEEIAKVIKRSDERTYEMFKSEERMEDLTESEFLKPLVEAENKLLEVLGIRKKIHA